MKSKLYSRLIMAFAAVFMFTYFASAQTTVEVQILDPLDDAEEYASDVGGEVPGSVYNTSSDLELVFDSEVQYVGMIFRELAVPAGATITNAYVQFQVDAVVEGVTDAAVTLEIYGSKEANVTVGFDEAVANGISSRTPTDAKVAWAPGPSIAEGDRGENERTDDISTIITEIIGLDGWASGNNLMVIIKWTGDVNQTDNINREMESADGDAAGAPTLVVTYEEGGGGGEQLTAEIQILDPLDDAEEYASDVGGEVIGAVYNTSSDLELVFDSEVQYVGMIFREVPVPAGSTIDNAYVQFQVDAVVEGVTDAAVTLEIYGSKEANVTVGFDEAVANGISGRTPTDAKVAWAPGPSIAEGDRGENERTDDISTIITEIIGLDGWAANNNMMIIIKWTGDVNQTDNINREMESADGDAAGAPTLVVTYTTSGGTRVEKFVEFSSLIYPNPTEGRLYINNPSSDKFDFEIYTINGRMVRSQQNNTGSNVEVDLSDFVKGMYFVNVRNAERSETHKLILK